MIQIMYPQFFTFHIESVYEDGYYYNLINIMTEPQNFELPQYRKTPFMSIVIKNKSNWSKDFDMKDNAPGCLDNRNKMEAIVDLLRSQYTNINCYSCYKDPEYDTLTSKFDPSNKFHTMIFTNNAKKSTNTNYVVIGIPCKGVVQQITKSPLYKLYNGSMIVMTNTPFKFRNELYNKLVYLLVDITSSFSFSEYIYTDSEEDIRKVITHNLAINPNFYLHDTTACDLNIYLDNSGISRINNKNNMEVFYYTISSLIPCEERTDRQDFFIYSGKSMFHLSDIPESIKQNKGNIAVKL